MIGGYIVNIDELILKMFNNGIGINKIKNILQISELEVRECLIKNGISVFSEHYVERNENVCNLYLQGIKITEIANLLSINRHTVTDILKKNQIYKGNIRANNFSDEKFERNQKIIDLYSKGFSLRQVADKMKVCSSTVSNVLHVHGINTRPQHQTGHSKGTSKNRKYFFDENFFEIIDTEEKAYWLGFLYADGYVAYRGVIYLVLQEKDLNHLQKFRSILNAEKIPIRHKIKTKSYSFVVSSVKMAENLSKLGCFQKKSLRLEFPTQNQVPMEFIHHFMRGFFDGDGCIHISKKSFSSTFSIISTKNFLDAYENILLQNIPSLQKTKHVHNKVWNENTESIVYTGNKRVVDIYNFLYKNATIYLERKKCKFEEVATRLKTKLRKS